MTDKKPTILNEGESYAAREAMMRAKREAQLLAQQQAAATAAKPVNPPVTKK